MKIRNFTEAFEVICEELANWNFKYVSYKANCSTTMLYSWINGKTKSPHMRTFISVANAIGFTITLNKDNQVTKVKK